jgi:subtilisin family serine protease
VSGLVLLVLSALELHRLGPARRFVPEPYAEAAVIHLASGDSVPAQSGISNIQSAIASSRYVLVHLPCPVTQHGLGALRAAGLEPVGYLAYQNVICRRLDTRGSASGIDWPVLPFLPEYKLAPEFGRSPLATRHSPLALSVWPGEDASAAAARLAELGATILHVTPRAVTALAEPTVAASLDAVAWVQAAGRCEPLNVDVQWVMQTGWHPETPDPVLGRRVWSHGIQGQGEVVGLFDSGIYTDHLMFLDPAQRLTGPGIFPTHRKIAAYKLFREAAFGDAGALSYPGTAVAGTLAGSDSAAGGASLLDGVAPEARIYFLDIATYARYIYYDDVTEMLDSVRLSLGMPEPVRLVSGSFGSMDAMSYYRLADAAADAVCWLDKDFLPVWAAGNAGGGRYRIGHPSCAKNVLTVGGTENGIFCNRLYDASSIGPTRDNRVKPNIVAPADSIFTARGSDTAEYSERSGTSMSAPAVCGALALVRQYFRDGWYPDGFPDPSRRIDRLSSALLRAIAVTGADSNVSFAQVPSDAVGWGRLNLAQVLHFPGDSVSLDFVDERRGVATGEYQEYEFLYGRRDPMRVTLAWTDTAAAPNADIALVNDLNLELVSPDGNYYRGSQFAGGQSAANPPGWDERNVEEVCQLFLPLAGRWRARVYGRNVYTPRQPYALVVKAGLVRPAVAEPGPGAALSIRSLISTPAHPARFRIGDGQRLVVTAADGRRVAMLTGPLDWRSSLLSSGVYYCDVPGNGRVRLVVRR